MAKITLIAAVDEAGGIGLKGQLLCHLPADLKHFKQLTSGHTVLMGRKTFDSLPNGALPMRRNIVVSRQQDLTIAKCDVAKSIDDAFALVDKDEDLFVIGGDTIYAQTIANADFLEITKIHHRFDADAFFPAIDPEVWLLISSSDFDADDKNPYPYSFLTYRKK